MPTLQGRVRSGVLIYHLPNDEIRSELCAPHVSEYLGGSCSWANAECGAPNDLRNEPSPAFGSHSNLPLRSRCTPGSATGSQREVTMGAESGRSLNSIA